MLKDEYGFDEFDDVSLEAWKALIAHENGEISADDFNWKVSSGVEVSPFHHKGERSNLVRNNADWLFSHNYCHQLVWEETNNKDILDNLLNGADGIVLRTDNGFDFNKVLAGVHADSCHLCFSTSDAVTFHGKYYDWLSQQLVDINKVNGLLLPNLTKQTNAQPYKKALKDYDQLLSGAKRVNGVKSIPLQLSGLGFTEHPEKELGLLCAQMVDGINELTSLDHKTVEIAKQMFLYLPLGDVFFLEIAKIKSLKLLTALVLSQYKDLKGGVNLPVLVEAQPAAGKEMISGTVQAMAAQLGGADFMCINGNSSGQSGKRIARNVMNILKEESHLDKTTNPLQGAYFLEEMVDTLTRKSWDVFLGIQEAGGYQSLMDEKGFFE